MNNDKTFRPTVLERLENSTGTTSKILRCLDCNAEFQFTEFDHFCYERTGSSEFKRCLRCRDLRYLKEAGFF